ncbi:hypothetical protein BS78_05G137700 [Paspalum vaginatum]|nr:hypothetical protein BS78_05G137700 [Paspalum vaginatum]
MPPLDPAPTHARLRLSAGRLDPMLAPCYHRTMVSLPMPPLYSMLAPRRAANPAPARRPRIKIVVAQNHPGALAARKNRRAQTCTSPMSKPPTHVPYYPTPPCPRRPQPSLLALPLTHASSRTMLMPSAVGPRRSPPGPGPGPGLGPGCPLLPRPVPAAVALDPRRYQRLASLHVLQAAGATAFQVRSRRFIREGPDLVDCQLPPTSPSTRSSSSTLADAAGPIQDHEFCALSSPMRSKDPRRSVSLLNPAQVVTTYAKLDMYEDLTTNYFIAPWLQTYLTFFGY